MKVGVRGYWQPCSLVHGCRSKVRSMIIGVLGALKEKFSVTKFHPNVNPQWIEGTHFNWCM